MAPLPMNVTATGTCSPRANARSSGEACRRRTPLPARISGRSGPRPARAACRSPRRSAPGRRPRPRQWRSSSPTSVAAMSSGSSMWVGPGFSRRATRKALRTISGIVARSTRGFHFVIGSSIRTMSTYWCASLWTLSMAAWPVSATIGARSRNASAMPVTRLVAPGPRVAIATAAAAGQPAVDVGHEGRALLVAGGDVADPRVDRDSASRTSIVSSPGTEKTYSSPRPRGTRRGGAPHCGRDRGLGHRAECIGGARLDLPRTYPWGVVRARRAHEGIHGHDAVGRRDDRVEVDLEDVLASDDELAERDQEPSERVDLDAGPASESVQDRRAVKAVDGRRARSRSIGARATATSSRTSAGPRPAPPGRPARRPHHGAPPTMSSTPGGAIGWTRTPRNGSAGGAPRRELAAAARIHGVGQAQSHAADVRLVRKALGVELHGHRPAPECAPGGDGGVRVAGRAHRVTGTPAARASARLSRSDSGRGRAAASLERAAGSGSGSSPQAVRSAASRASHDGRGRVAAPACRRSHHARRAMAANASTAPRSIGIPPAASSVACIAASLAAREDDVHREQLRAVARWRRSAGGRRFGRVHLGRQSRNGESWTIASTSYAPDAASASNAARYAGSGRRHPRGRAGCRCSPSSAAGEDAPARAASGTGGRSSAGPRREVRDEGGLAGGHRHHARSGLGRTAAQAPAAAKSSAASISSSRSPHRTTPAASSAASVTRSSPARDRHCAPRPPPAPGRCARPSPRGSACRASA